MMHVLDSQPAMAHEAERLAELSWTLALYLQHQPGGLVRGLGDGRKRRGLALWVRCAVFALVMSRSVELGGLLRALLRPLLVPVGATGE